MKPLPLALVAAFAAHAPAALSAQDSWTANVQQGQTVFKATEVARLQRAPFSISFVGSPTMGFAVLAATSCSPLEKLKATEEVSAAIRPTNIVVEDASKDEAFLMVNSSASIVADEQSAHVWAEDKENDIHSFQEIKPLPGGQVASTRTIRNFTLQLQPGQAKTGKMANFRGSEICLLVTGLPPVGYMAHTEPRLLRILFE